MKIKELVKSKRFDVFKTYVMLTLGTALIAAEVHFFEVPNGFTIGGVSGLSIAIGAAFNLSVTNLLVGLNLLLLIIGFIFLGKGCGLRTVYCTIMYSGLMKLLGWLCPLDKPLTDEPLLELCCVIVLTAIGSGLIFHCDATSGGTDIVAMIAKKYTSLDVGKALLAVDFLVALSSFWVFDLKTGFISMLGVFARSFLIDSVVESIDSCKYFTIITTKPEEVRSYILESMDRGATIVKATGAYTGGEKTILYTVCRRFEALKLQRVVHEKDPDAFVIITTSSEIIGSGFRHI